eukprot:scaffold681_cov153-Isochrysis_galbana.AAC.1
MNDCIQSSHKKTAPKEDPLDALSTRSQDRPRDEPLADGAGVHGIRRSFGSAPPDHVGCAQGPASHHLCAAARRQRRSHTLIASVPCAHARRRMGRLWIPRHPRAGHRPPRPDRASAADTARPHRAPVGIVRAALPPIRIPTRLPRGRGKPPDARPRAERPRLVPSPPTGMSRPQVRRLHGHVCLRGGLQGVPTEVFSSGRAACNDALALPLAPVAPHPAGALLFDGPVPRLQEAQDRLLVHQHRRRLHRRSCEASTLPVSANTHT